MPSFTPPMLAQQEGILASVLRSVGALADVANTPKPAMRESVLRNPLPMEGRLTFLPAMVNNGQRELALPGILAGAWNAFTAPGRAYSGNMEDPMGEAMNFAGMMNLGAMPSPAVGGPGTLGMNVYHGSPHKFDKFDASAINKDAGGSSFGKGVNLSADKNHAQVYGKNIYKVDLPDADIASFIKWEKPVSQELAKQIPPVDFSKPVPFGGGAFINRTPDGDWLLKANAKHEGFRLTEKEVMRMFGDQNTGEQVYRRLVAALGDEAAASKWLLERGYKGIENTTERNARNFVVFDDKIPQIIGRE